MRSSFRSVAVLLLLLLLTGCGSSDRSARRVTIPGVTESLNPGAPASEPVVTAPAPGGVAPAPGGAATVPGGVDLGQSSPPVAAAMLKSGIAIEVRLLPLPPGVSYTLPLDVIVVVTNQRSEPVRWYASPDCPDPTIVRAVLADGESIPLLKEGAPKHCSDVLIPKELVPGRQVVGNYRLSGSLAEATGAQLIASFPIGTEPEATERVEVSLDLALPAPK